MHAYRFIGPGFCQGGTVLRHSEAENGINGPSNGANEWPFNCSELNWFPVVEDESQTSWVVIISGSYLITRPPLVWKCGHRHGCYIEDRHFAVLFWGHVVYHQAEEIT